MIHGNFLNANFLHSSSIRMQNKPFIWILTIFCQSSINGCRGLISLPQYCNYNSGFFMPKGTEEMYFNYFGLMILGPYPTVRNYYETAPTPALKQGARKDHGPTFIEKLCISIFWPFQLGRDILRCESYMLSE